MTLESFSQPDPVPIYLLNPECSEDAPRPSEQVTMSLALYLLKYPAQYAGVLLGELFPLLLQMVHLSNDMAQRDRMAQSQNVIDALMAFRSKKQDWDFEITQLQDTDELTETYDNFVREHLISELKPEEDPLLMDTFTEFHSHPVSAEEIYSKYNMVKGLKALAEFAMNVLGKSISMGLQDSQVEVIQHSNKPFKGDYDIVHSNAGQKSRIKVREEGPGFPFRHFNPGEE